MAVKATPTATLLLAVLCAALPQASHSHGLVVWPPSRNWVAYLSRNDHWADGLSAGGVSGVSAQGKLTWPHVQRGMCGDASDRQYWDTPRSIQATYSPGQTITVDTVVSVNHMGRFSLQVCSLDAKASDISSKCKPLKRADPAGSGKTYWYMPFVEGWNGGSHGTSKPRYGDNSYAYYPHPGISGAADGCTTQATCYQFRDMLTYRTWWKLPDGFKCDHCKLEWQWMTAHKCWPPCPEENANEPTCRNSQDYKQCGTPGAEYPESFYNCADISIKDNARVSPREPHWATGDKVKVTGGYFGDRSPIKLGGR